MIDDALSEGLEELNSPVIAYARALYVFAGEDRVKFANKI